MNAISDPTLGRRADSRGPAQHGHADRFGALSKPGTAPDSDGDLAEHTLRRTGRKPVRFKGHQIIEATGPGGRSSVRHDINVYRSDSGRIVVETIARREALGHQDLFRVKTFETLAAAAGWLEAYRCIDDVPVPPGLSGAETALPWMVLASVQLRQQIERVEADFQALISEIFLALEITDPDEVEPPQRVDDPRE